MRKTAILAVLPIGFAATYPVKESWKGDTFLDGFNLDVSSFDNTTNGDTFWARPGNDTIIYTTEAGTQILKVDNTTFVPYNEKRFAPKLVSRSQYGVGTVWVIDAAHVPWGCSVWPAIWTQGPNWPAGGEIDIFEGVNNQATNQMALHSSGTGCTADVSAPMVGNVTQAQCANSASAGAGCTVIDPAPESYGPEFAAGGGGVFIAELSVVGVKVWFYPRSAIPSQVVADATTIDTSLLDRPGAFYPSTACNVDEYLQAQTLTIDITLCGDWAGQPQILEASCPALKPEMTCYTTYVINDGGSAYANAYFELNYVNIFSTASAERSFLQGPAAGSRTISDPVSTAHTAFPSSVTPSETTIAYTTSDAPPTTTGTTSRQNGAPLRAVCERTKWMAVAVASFTVGLMCIHGARL